MPALGFAVIPAGKGLFATYLPQPCTLVDLSGRPDRVRLSRRQCRREKHGPELYGWGASFLYLVVLSMEIFVGVLVIGAIVALRSARNEFELGIGQFDRLFQKAFTHFILP